MSHSGLGLWFFLTLFRSVTSSSEKHRNLLALAHSTEEGGGLDGGASRVITPREGGLKPVSMGRGGAGRGGGQTPSQRKQKSRAAVRARSSAETADAAGGLAVQGAVASPAEVGKDKRRTTSLKPFPVWNTLLAPVIFLEVESLFLIRMRSGFI